MPTFQKHDIFSFSPRSKSAQAYDKLIREIFLPGVRCNRKYS